MSGELVVVRRPGLSDVDVLEQVGERPPVGAADREGGVPDARSVLAARRNAGHVAGGLMPAALKAAVEYQTVDLLAPLKKRP